MDLFNKIDDFEFHLSEEEKSCATIETGEQHLYCLEKLHQILIT